MALTGKALEEWKKKNEIYGCGRPFRLNAKREPEICDYI
jgi:hypothetical protein